MDHTDESAAKHHPHCGCGGSHGAQQGAGSGWSTFGGDARSAISCFFSRYSSLSISPRANRSSRMSKAAAAGRASS